jgi:hypothetical protein
VEEINPSQSYLDWKWDASTMPHSVHNSVAQMKGAHGEAFIERRERNARRTSRPGDDTKARVIIPP